MSHKIEKQENGLYKIRVWSKRDALGKRKSKQEKDISGITAAKKRAEELEYELEENIIDITFNKLDDLHYQERKDKLSPVTLDTVYKYDRTKVRDYFGNLKVKKINTLLVQNFIDQKQKEGLRKKTVKNLVSYLLSVINWGINYDYVDYNRIKKLNYKDDEEEFEATTLEIEQLAEVLNFLKKHYYNLYIPCLISVLTGSRRGETLGLTWEDIDFENNLITFQNNMVPVNGKVISKKSLKGSRTRKRVVPMSNFLKEELKTHLNKFSIQTIDNHVCSNVFIGTITPDYITHKFHDFMLNKYNIEMREHDLRHTFRQIVHDNEDLLLDSSKIMGHSSVKITKNIYTRNRVTRSMFDLVNGIAEELRNQMCAKKCAI